MKQRFGLGASQSRIKIFSDANVPIVEKVTVCVVIIRLRELSIDEIHDG